VVCLYKPNVGRHLYIQLLGRQHDAVGLRTTNCIRHLHIQLPVHQFCAAIRLDTNTGRRLQV